MTARGPELTLSLNPTSGCGPGKGLTAFSHGGGSVANSRAAAPDLGSRSPLPSRSLWEALFVTWVVVLGWSPWAPALWKPGNLSQEWSEKAAPPKATAEHKVQRVTYQRRLRNLWTILRIFVLGRWETRNISEPSFGGGTRVYLLVMMATLNRMHSTLPFKANIYFFSGSHSFFWKKPFLKDPVCWNLPALLRPGCCCTHSLWTWGWWGVNSRTG